MTKIIYFFYMFFLVVFIMFLSEAKAGFTGVTKCGDIFSDKNECSNALNEECSEFQGGFCGSYDVVTVSEDVPNYDAPIFSDESEIDLCSSEEECNEIIKNKKCSLGSPYISKNFKRVYCSQVIGYKTKVVKRKEFVKNDAKESAVITSLENERFNESKKRKDKDDSVINLKSLKSEIDNATNTAQIKAVLVKLIKELSIAIDK